MPSREGGGRTTGGQGGRQPDTVALEADWRSGRTTGAGRMSMAGRQQHYSSPSVWHGAGRR
jgi:hypothetical protein